MIRKPVYLADIPTHKVTTPWLNVKVHHSRVALRNRRSVRNRCSSVADSVADNANPPFDRGEGRGRRRFSPFRRPRIVLAVIPLEIEIEVHGETWTPIT